MTTLWVCGQNVDTGEGWEFMGVFTTEEAALAQCATDRFWLGPVELDKYLSHESEVWPGGYMPHLGKA